MTTYNKLKQTSKTFSNKNKKKKKTCKKENNNSHAKETHPKKLHLNEINIVSANKKKR